jgi:hypothetical protein
VTFGWQGFSLQHPDDWAPVAITGNRREGYVRLGSPGRLSLQVRWRSLGPSPDLTLFLRDYFGRLKRDAKRSHVPFDTEEIPDGNVLNYGYRGATFGRGQIRYGACGRVFVLEVASTQNDSLKGPLRLASRTFESGAPNDLWSVLGLRLRLPLNLDVERREFVAGRTRLWLRNRDATIVGERWGFADQLLQKHDLGEWAKAVLNAPAANVSLQPDSAHLDWPTLPWRIPAEALVRHDRESNQLVLVSVRSRRSEWMPQWEWLTG